MVTPQDSSQNTSSCSTGESSPSSNSSYETPAQTPKASDNNVRADTDSAGSDNLSNRQRSFTEPILTGHLGSHGAAETCERDLAADARERHRPEDRHTSAYTRYDLSIIRGLQVDNEGFVHNTSGAVGQVWRGQHADPHGHFVGRRGEVLNSRDNLVGRVRLLGRDPPLEQIPLLTDVVITGWGGLFADDGYHIGDVDQRWLREPFERQQGKFANVRNYFDGSLVAGLDFGSDLWFNDQEGKVLRRDLGWESTADSAMVCRKGGVFSEAGEYLGEIVAGDFSECAGKVVDSLGRILNESGGVIGRAERYTVERLADFRWKPSRDEEVGVQTVNREEEKRAVQFLSNCRVSDDGQDLINPDGVLVAQVLGGPPRTPIKHVYQIPYDGLYEFVQLTAAGKEIYHWRARHPDLNARLERCAAERQLNEEQLEFIERADEGRGKILASWRGGTTTASAVAHAGRQLERQELMLKIRKRWIEHEARRLNTWENEVRLIMKASMQARTRFAPWLTQQGASPPVLSRVQMKSRGTQVQESSNLQEDPAFVDFERAKREGRSRTACLTLEARRKLDGEDPVPLLTQKRSEQVTQASDLEDADKTGTQLRPSDFKNDDNDMAHTLPTSGALRYDLYKPRDYYNEVLEETRTAIEAGLETLRDEFGYRLLSNPNVDRQQNPYTSEILFGIAHDMAIPSKGVKRGFANHSSRLGHHFSHLLKMVDNIERRLDVLRYRTPEAEQISDSARRLVVEVSEHIHEVASYDAMATSIFSDMIELRNSLISTYTDPESGLRLALLYNSTVRDLNKRTGQLRDMQGQLLTLCSELLDKFRAIVSDLGRIYDERPETKADEGLPLKGERMAQQNAARQEGTRQRGAQQGPATGSTEDRSYHATVEDAEDEDEDEEEEGAKEEDEEEDEEEEL